MHLTARVKRVRVEAEGLREVERARPRAKRAEWGGGPGGAQMLTAVAAVTSTSQWQLALFNTQRRAGGINRVGGVQPSLAMSHVHMSNRSCHAVCL